MAVCNLSDPRASQAAMHPSLRAASRLTATGALLALVFLAAGCASEEERPQASRGAGHHRQFPTMAGTGTFFHDSIRAEVLVGAMTGFEAGGGGAGAGTGGGRRHHGGTSMHMVGGMGGASMSGGRRPDGGGD